MLASRGEEIDVPPVPLWHPTITLITAGGYKDNLLLGRVAPEESAFLKSGVELFVMRLPEDGGQFHFALNGEDMRYLSGESVEKEQLVFSQARYSQPLGVNWQAALGLQYVYLDQVLDVSTLETNLVALQVQGHQLRTSPEVRRAFSEVGDVEFAFPVTRYWFSAPIDDLWEWGPRVTFSRPYGNDSQWSLSFIYDRRDYDERPKTDREGRPIPNSTIAFDQHRFEFAWRHHLDQQKRWRLQTKLSYKLNQDNASGFFDYLRFAGAEQIRFRAGKWEISGEARFGFYDYVTQPAREGGSSTRERAELGGSVRLEREVARWLRLFLEYEYEQIVANQRIEEYTVNIVSGGMMWDF